MLAGALRERRVAGRQQNKVIEIRTGKAQGPAIPGQEDQRPPAEVFAAFVAARLPSRDEDPQIAGRTIAGDEVHGRYPAS